MVNLPKRKYPELMKVKGKIKEEKETIESVAEKSGMARNTLSRKLNGYTPMTLPEMYKIAKILGIDPDEIVDYFFINWLQNAKKEKRGIKNGSSDKKSNS